jgi:hypothetical protein
MRKLYIIVSLLLVSAMSFGQAPSGMSYQGVVRDSGGALVVSQAVGMQISILLGSSQGSAVYRETQPAITNANGFLSLEIGTGSTTDDFSAIDWSSGSYFIKTETDPTGGSNYSIMGTSQLVSVPYALYAKTAESSLMPTMTNAERLAMSDPATTLMVYVTDFAGGTVMLYDGSKWKELSLIQLRTLPDSPTVVSVTATDGEATVSFTAPSNDGGSVITSYTATSNPEGITGTQNQSESGTIIVRGLTNGTAYFFTVKATNAIGSSAASDVSNTVTPATVPDVPTDVAATAGDRQAKISFKAPSNDGGSAITSYTAASENGGVTGTVSQSGSGSITVTGLTNGVAYSFTVAATNAKGSSVVSAASNIVTPRGAPDAPTGVSATAGDRQATISFTAPSNDGGSLITSYTATSENGGFTGTVSQAGSGAITVIGLTNDTSYTFRVTATNALGTSVASTASNSVIPATTADSPTGVTATAADRQATVSFTAPLSDGGSPITQYAATSSPGGITGTLSQAGSGAIIVRGLTNGTAYFFTVKATNAIGSSAASDVSNTVTPATTPDSPTGVTATAGNTQATVSFIAPASDGGSAITSYTATSNQGGITGTLSQAGSGAITVTGLTNGVVYSFTVRATNAKGTSASSVVSNTVTPATPPDAPTGVSARVGNTQAIISFTAPSFNGGSPITQYTATSRPGNFTGTLSRSGSGAIIVTGLTNGTSYTFSVTATNAIGTSTSSAFSTSSTQPIAIGDTLEGGIVFYLDGSGGGKVCAAADQSAGIKWALPAYQSTSVPSPGATSTTNGAANTDAIIAQTGQAAANTYAAGLCRTYDGGGFNDWYLPATNELDLMHDNLHVAGLGGFSSAWYWTSNEFSTTHGFFQNFSDGGITGVNKNASNLKVRAVRTFSGTLTIPDSPTGVTATAGDRQATVSFTAPPNDGGSPITKYVAISNRGGRYTSLSQAGSGAITVTGLTNGVAYTFTVTAINAIGTSVASAVSNSVTPSTVPDAPTGVTATAADRQATVSFTAPLSDGGSPITRYTATSSPGGITGALSQVGSGAIIVRGLTNGVSYTFTVTATNETGTSVASDASNIVTPSSPVAIGDLRAGGVVFWVDPRDNTHGLVCALQDYPSQVAWGCYGTDLPNVPNVAYNGGNPVGAGVKIGDGESNTTGILADCSSAPAALAARSYGAEWFLPSAMELNQIYINRATLEAVSGVVAFSKNYWSSTELNYDTAWEQYFNNIWGTRNPSDKFYTKYVRAVRAF